MVRSFHYAAYMALADGTIVRDTDRATALPWADAWYCGSAASCADARTGRRRVFLPKDDETLR